MPDVTIEIGGRAFTVACQDGEEGYLKAAADLLNREAQALVDAGLRLTQDRMLLMAGLMLADKSISHEEELRTMDRRLAQQTQTLEELQNKPAPAPEKVEVEVVKEIEVERVPQAALDRVDALAKKADDLLARAKAMGGGAAA